MRRSRVFLAIVSLHCILAASAAIGQQDMLLVIDDINGIVIDHSRSGEISPYLGDWFADGSVHFRVFHNVFYDPPGTINVVSLAEITNERGEIIATSNRVVSSKYYRVNVSVSGQSFDLRARDLNFMDEGPTEGALVFTPPLTRNSRLPGGRYSLAVTLWEYTAGAGLTRQLSQTHVEEFTLIGEDQDLELTVTVTERSAFFSDWQRNPNPARIEVRNLFRHAYSVYMDARIDDDLGTLAETRERAGRSLPSIDIPAAAGFTIPGRSIPFFDPRIDPEVREDLFHFRDDAQEYRRAGHFPEGENYRLCIQLRKFDDDRIVGVYQCSDPFAMSYPPPPELFAPNDNDRCVENQSFQWTHDNWPSLTAATRYTLQIMAVPASNEVSPDIFTRLDRINDIEYTEIAGTSTQIRLEDRRRLVAGRRYAWRVRAAATRDGFPVMFQNDGYSEVWTFIFGLAPNPAPVLQSPADGGSPALPMTLRWTGVTLRSGGSASYTLNIKEIAAGVEVSPDYLEAGAASAPAPSTTFELPDAAFTLQTGHRYAWQVQAFDPTGRETEFENGGRSEVWTFTVGAGAGEGGALNIVMSYPSDDIRIADDQPPFVADPLFDRSGTKSVTLTIEELERGDGAALAEPRVFTSRGELTERNAMLFLNSYGSGGSVPPGQPFFAATWSTVPGSRYRWTLEIAPAEGDGPAYRQSAEFRSAPRADMLSPADGVEVNPAAAQLRFRVLRPTVELGAGHGIFAPGNPPSAGSLRYIMNPVIRRAVEDDTVIRFQSHRDLVFPGGIGSPFEHSEEFPRLQDGRYRWIVNTKYGDRIVAATEAEEFTVTGSGLHCDGSCVCVEGIYPANAEAPGPDQLIPFNGEGRFSIGFRPLVNRDALEGGTISVWLRRGLEGHEVTEARAPDFVGNFTRENLTLRGDAAELSAFDVDLRNEAGEHLRLLPDTNYMWRIEARFDPVRVRQDGTLCPEGVTTVRSAQLFFATMREVECSEPCICVSPVSPAPNAVSVAPTERARFRIQLAPGIHEEALRRGTISVWPRRGDESVETATERLASYTGYFSSFSRIGDDPLSGIYEVEPRDGAGEYLTLLAGLSYFWAAEVEYNPESIRHDGERCFESHDHSRSDTVLFTMRARAQECNPLTLNVSHPAPGSPLPEELRIGGYMMTLERETCRLGDNGHITGTGADGKGFGIVRAPEGNWAVEFTDLEINTDGEVLFGKATARIREDIPADLQRQLATGAAFTADQIRSLNQLWHGGGTLLESLAGDRRVPLGFTFDADFAGAATSGGWGFKTAITHVSFEPTLASWDIAAGLRAPITTNEGEEAEWIGLYVQGIPRCLEPGTRWRAALRLLGDMDFGTPDMTDWEFFIKHSEREEMPPDYTLQPGDGTAMVISERGVEQLHIEAGIRLPRSFLVPQQESAAGSGNWQDVPPGAGGQTELRGTFDYTREGREVHSLDDRPGDQMGGGFYLIADLPRSRIAGMAISITARGCVIDQSTSWSPRADAGATYSVPGLGVGAFQSRGAGFNRPADWKGFFIKEGTIDAAPLGTPIGIRNAYSSSPISFTAFAAPGEEVRIGDSFTARLDTVDFEIDRGNFVRARVVTSMTFPGAMEGRIGLDLVYQQIPEDGARHEADAFIASLSAREDERFRLTDYIAFTIRRGSQMNVTYTDPPLRRGGSKWGFIMDLSGGLKFSKRNGRGDDVISIGGIDFEHLRFSTEGRGVEAPRITFFGVEIPRDTVAEGGAGDPRGNEAERKQQVVGGFPIGLRSLDLTFGNDGFSMGVEAVLTLALTGEAEEGERSGPVFGGSLGIALDGMLEMREGRLQWQAPSLRLTSLGVNYRSDPLTIEGEVEFYDDDPEWGNGFSGNLSVSMAKMFSATAAMRLGTRDAYRYWFILGDLTSAAPIAVIGPVGVFGFLGGAYQHMQVRETRDDADVVTNVTYTPTADNTFGIMAGVHIGLAARPSTFHAKVLLTARFRDANLTDIDLDGKGWFMCDLERECNGRDDSWLTVHMGFDFPESRFHASLAGQIVMNPLLRIEAPDGSVDILFEPENWHVYIGRGPFSSPEARTISASFFPDFARIEADSYFMAGNAIDINVGGIPLRGGGFAAGVRVNIDVGGKFLIFYGRIWGHFQAELAVIRVDESGSSCLEGANGWYALVNLNLGLGLEVGIDVDLWLVSGRFEIFRAEIGIDLLLGGPNPTFVDGDAQGSYRILGGVISGRFHYHLHIGDETPRECITAAIDDQFRMPEPIVSVSPTENQTDVSVFTTVGLGFALPEHGEITVRRDGQPVRARFILQTPLDIRPAAGGAVVAGNLTFSTDSLSAEWTTDDVLMPRTSYTVSAVAIAQERRAGRWVETRRQTRAWSFTTGDRPRDVYDPNILSYSYPLKEQRYSYVNGHDGSHYLHLQRNMDYLFTNMASTQSLVAQYTDRNNAVHEAPLRYERFRAGCGAFLVVDDPAVSANSIYHLRLVKRTDPERNRGLGERLVAEGFPALMADYTRVSVTAYQRARQVAMQSGGDMHRFETGAGSYLVERKQGNATSRVRRNGRIIDSVMYDWFFGVGNSQSPDEKFAAMNTTYRSRLGGFIFFSLHSPEPVDDDLSAGLFIRQRSKGTDPPAAAWFNHVERNDRLARDRELLVSSIGEHDAAEVESFVLVHDSRLPINTLTYVDAMAPWNFNGSNHGRYRLNASDMRFEEQRNLGGIAPGPAGGFQIQAPGMAAGAAGNPPRLEHAGYSDDMAVCPLNATMDFNSMVWRYRHVRHETVREGFLEFPMWMRISFASSLLLMEIGEREWETQPSGDYAIAIIAKTPGWRLQSYAESRHGARSDVKLLDLVSESGRASVIRFGRAACGDPGDIPFVILPLRVPR